MKSADGNQLVEVLQYEGIGYKPILTCRDWRVAILNYHEELLVQNINNFQQHSLTDEAFVLLKGKCTLFVADDEKIENVHGIDMEPYKLYNIKKGVYHTHTLSEDAMVLIVEADDTCDDNSPMVLVDDAIRARIIKAYEEANA